MNLSLSRNIFPKLFLKTRVIWEAEYFYQLAQQLKRRNISSAMKLVINSEN